jgi:hypothetical protein
VVVGAPARGADPLPAKRLLVRQEVGAAALEYGWPGEHRLDRIYRTSR